ncbi:MAG TPA: DNA mismatch repair protein MutS [Candidatus Copromorpha excrementipullorum]|uniref:DNA mismatch repair protein MutS n=1 Tax=Candidatus Allocopromorpha excrementipullorum TaxID=2840743 RepID=A0A9D1N6V8_9FIRM|nr:DNA mismatch repair protein MutS [Candidatus Copromorpha excrementipullorum]
MMRQYMEIKEEYKDCILFFRLGDFYEMFFEDAKLVSRELELTLTGKNCGMEERAPMCGVPFHSAETYIARLVERGYKVAICEQTEDPASAKGIVKREVIQIVTPGTVISSSMLDENENNYIASVVADDRAIGLSYCDVSTGEIRLTSIKGSGMAESLINELVKINAREIVLDETTGQLLDADNMKNITGAYFNVLAASYYEPYAVRSAILRQFDVSALLGLGIEEDSASEAALGALLIYLHETQKKSLGHIAQLNVYSMGQNMSLDKATIKNLELTETLFEKKIRGSLLGVLDKTHTAMGSRKLKQWIKEPLNDVTAINDRLDAVEALLDQVIIRNNIKESLKRVYDFERLTGRIACGTANGKDLIALRNSCSVLPDIKDELASMETALVSGIAENIHSLEHVYDLIDKGIVEDPPFSVREGGIIKEGHSDQLDALKASIKDAQDWIAGLEHSERERTGIKNLKVGYNKVFGYYLEVTRSYYDLIPDNYIRKQTLANCERFITPELKETERLVLNAEAKINQMEYQLFTEIRQQLQGYIREIQETSKAIAALDVLVSFAEISEKNDYVKPSVDGSDVIEIRKGRHPVIEQTIRDGIFVSNDTYLNRSDQSLLLITGPNMSGKSTYMRQTALIVLMAQAGCFVPCQEARIGVCDRIFTRIGASDNLAQGQSTFFVEMSELSYILNTATSRSLVILDEIGRGTSTYDGLSIAWAAAEFLCRPQRMIRTLFATHYHEMTRLEDSIEGVKNLNVDVAEENGDVVFLHKIVEGSASRSYGIHVAKLAGAPKELLERAEERLFELESGAEAAMAKPLAAELTATPVAAAGAVEAEETQLSFLGSIPDPVTEKLRNLDLMNTTPSEALRILEELKEHI